MNVNCELCDNESDFVFISHNEAETSCDVM